MLKFISSIRLAVILIATLAGMAVSATIFDQSDVFTSRPFLAVVAIFFVNLLTCTVQLWPALLRRLCRQVSDIAAKKSGFVPVNMTPEDLQALLKQERFSLRETKDGEDTVLYAVRGRLALMAPHVLHVAILIIIAGAVLSSFGVKATMQVAAGDVQALPAKIAEASGISDLAVKSFATEYDDKGQVANWRTDFELFTKGKKVDAGTTQVNHPYKKSGLSVYQMGYGKRFQMQLDGPRAELSGTYAFPEEQKIPLPDGHFMVQTMGDRALLFMQFDRAGKMIRQEALRPKAGLNLADGTRLTYLRPLEYTVLELKYGHGVIAVFSGFVLAALASLMMLMGRYAALGARIDATGAVSIWLDAKGHTRRRLSQALTLKDVTSDD